jgi:hypothetical protein
MENEFKEKSFNFVPILATVFMVTTAASTYVLANQMMYTYQLNKSAFVCTKIEQIGKNLDDVRCVQYTQQKFYKEAVSLNSFVK